MTMKRISLLFLLIVILQIQQLYADSFKNSSEILHEADSLYAENNFSEATVRFLQAIKDDEVLQRNMDLNFKIAYGFYKTGNYTKAKLLFGNKKSFNGFLPEYVDYFVFRSAIKLNNHSDDITSHGSNYLNNYPDHFLADSVKFLLAEYYFQSGIYSKAYKNYSNLRKRKAKFFRKVYLEKQMAICKFELNEKTNAIDRMTQILKKYPSTKEAMEIVQFIEQRRLDDDDMFFLKVEVYSEHRQFTFLNKKLEAFIRSTDDDQLIEKARYYLLKVYFQRGEYSSALYGFKNLIKNLKNEKLKPRLLVYTARCYLRLNEKENSAKTYIEYSKKFPRRRLAAETAWKSAWIYEELNNLGAALTQYRTVQKHWPRSVFRYEARFREGLTLFRLKYYTKAAAIFQDIAKGTWNASHRNRAKYWLILTYAKQNRFEESEVAAIELGSKLFESYYSLKAYLIHKTHRHLHRNVHFYQIHFLPE